MSLSDFFSTRSTARDAQAAATLTTDEGPAATAAPGDELLRCTDFAGALVRLLACPSRRERLALSEVNTACSCALRKPIGDLSVSGSPLRFGANCGFKLTS